MKPSLGLQLGGLHYAHDGFNPVQGAMIPGKAREPEETYAYNMVQILRILQILPLLPKAVVATASLAGLREGELRGLELPDYTGEAIAVNRSVWKGVVNRPKTRTSRQPVPVIPKLANLLDEYRASMGDSTTGAMFHNGSAAKAMDMDKLAHGLAGTVSAAGSPPIFISWAQTKRSRSGFSVTPSNTSPKTVTSRLLIQRCWKRCSGCKPRWTCWRRVQQMS
jgi:integrase